MKRIPLIVLCAAATLLQIQNVEIAEAQEQITYSKLQAQAVSLLPTMPKEVIEAIISNGNDPKTPTEHYIFSCLAPSIQFFDKREALSDTQFTDQFGNLAIELSQIYESEEECLQRGIQKRKIKLIRKADK